MRWFIVVVLLIGIASDSHGIVHAQNSARSRNSKPKTKPKRDITPLKKQYTERVEKYHRDLEKLAASGEKDNLPIAAEVIRDIAVPFSSQGFHKRDLPREVQERPTSELPEEEKAWRIGLRHLRRDYAQDLFALAQKSLNAGHISFTYELVCEVAHSDPDHAAARKALGFVRVGDEWKSPFEAKMDKDHKQWHTEFGWVPVDHLDRLKQGERFYKGRWISLEREAEMRRDFANAWEIRSEHYLVRTNHSLEKGVELATKLEGFHSLFFQSLTGFFNTPEQFRQLLTGSAAPKPPTKPLVVHFYRNRDEYLSRVRKETNQNVEITRGIYFPKTGVAHFFFDPEVSDDSTLYHEATHQLLSGARPGIGEIGMKSDFWCIEGIACYMESFHPESTEAPFGDPRTPRFQYAKAHFVVENYFLPLTEFSRMGMIAYQESREIKRNYAQGAALVHFFLHYNGGEYRDEFVEHLSQIYSVTKSVREKPTPLWELIGIPATEIDQQYREHIQLLGESGTSDDDADDNDEPKSKSVD